jgi:uncharacterized iron-regulated membrane protein
MIAILFLLLASVSGLVYSQIAGSIVNGIGFFSGQYDIFLEEVASPSLTKTSRDHEPEADRRIEDAIRGLSIAQQIEPRLNRLTVQLPGTPTGSLTVEAGADWGPSIQAVYRYDRGTGKLFSQTNVHELPPMAIGLMWNYPIHVGSVLGLYSQWFWFASALIVTALPWLGYLMTWLRKRRSTSLVPRSDAPLPNGIVGTLVILGVVFPTVGVTLIGFLILSVFRESKFGSTARSNRN